MILKKCRHGRGLTGNQRLKAWRKCGCAWMASVTIQGRREYVNLGPDETQAAATLLRLRADSMEGRARRRRPGREFGAVADSYLVTIAAAPGARANRVRTTASRVGRVKEWWGDIPVDAITIEQVRRFLDDCSARYAPNTAISLYSTLRSILGHAQDHGLVEALPLPARSRLSKVNARAANHLSVAEAGVLIEALPDPYGAMGELALLAGLRIGELAALDAQDFDRERRILHVHGTLAHDGTIGPPKTHHGRRAIPLSPRAFEILAARVKEGHVFPVPSLAMCGHVMRTALDRTGLYRPGRGWHALRHAHEALLEASGLGIRDAAARMGHGANFVQTAAYGWAAEAGDPADVDATRSRIAMQHGQVPIRD